MVYGGENCKDEIYFTDLSKIPRNSEAIVVDVTKGHYELPILTVLFIDGKYAHVGITAVQFISKPYIWGETGAFCPFFCAQNQGLL